MNDQENKLRDLFAEALEIEDRELRSAFLSERCGTDTSLRRQIEELLSADARAGEFLPRAPGGKRTPGARPFEVEHLDALKCVPPGEEVEEAGARIGRYKLLQKIGAGGCGVVYMAEQQEPVKRKVAVKVIKLGMDTRRVVARFEAERQALALMDHPNIAKVLDAGATANGRPFFVMELVRGIKITRYCDEQKLSAQQRLDLFIKVCQAVQHAHQKGIIHRDLKPSNILVTERDGQPEPKIIDFGIAKATGDLQLTDKTLFTAFEQFVGTPAYMSPEQARLGELDIDTRSDIYSLGVLLYELLTGKTPFDTKALTASGLDEMRRTIQEKPPPRPSTRLTHLAEAELADAANDRGMDPPKLIRLLSGDLDWIILKCLEKDRARRYATANGLAMDIQRHLERLPVVARPPTLLYEFQQLVRRHKGSFAAVTAILLALTLGGLVSALEAVRAKRAEQEQSRLRLMAADRAREAEIQAERARIAEADAKEKLWSSYLAQARAGRWSRRTGRRFEGLELLKKAAAMRPSLELRNEAIACMALADIRQVKQWQPRDYDTLIGFDGIYENYAFGDNEGNVHLCRVADDTELKVFRDFELPLAAIVLSSDGRFLLVACGKNRSHVEVYDLKRAELCLRLVEPQFRAAAFARDGTFLAIGFERPELNWPIRIFDLASRKEAASFGHGSLPYVIQFNPQHSDQLLTSDWSPTVRVWDWQTGKVRRTLEHQDGVWGIDWDPNGETVATGCGDNHIYLWDAMTGKLRGGLAGHSAVPRQIRFNADGDFLISADWNGELHLWDPKAQRELLSAAGSSYIYYFSTLNDRFGANLGAGKMEILELASSRFCRALHSNAATGEGFFSCDFSSKGGYLLCADLDGMRLWDLANRHEAGTVAEANQSRHFAFFDPDGSGVFLTASNGIQNWSVDRSESGEASVFRLRRTLGSGHRYGQVSVSRDGGRLAAANKDGMVVFDLVTGAEVHRLNTGYPLTTLTALSPDGQTAATWAPLSRSVQVWDLKSTNLLRELPARDDSIQVEFSPNGRWLAVGDGSEYRVWNRRTWQPLYALPRTAASTWGRMAFSPDSTVLAAAITRSTVQLFEAATGRDLATLELPDQMNIGWMAFSPDSTQLAVTSAPGLIQLWDLRAIREQLASMKLDWDLPPYH